MNLMKKITRVIFIQQYGETTSIHSSAALGYSKYNGCKLFSPLSTGICNVPDF